MWDLQLIFFLQKTKIPTQLKHTMQRFQIPSRREAHDCLCVWDNSFFETTEYHYPVVALSTIVLAGDLTIFGIVLEVDLGNSGIVLAGSLDLNSWLFYYWQTDQVGNNA